MNPGKRRLKQALAGMLILGGLILSGLAVFAYPLGLALDAKWGGGQTLLLALGLVVTLSGAGLLFQHVLAAAASRLGQAAERLSLRARQSAFGRRLEAWSGAVSASPPGRLWRAALDSRLVLAVRQNPSIQIALVTCAAVLVVEAFYLWYASVGYWTDWPDSTDYYDRLAVAFRGGQVSLLEQPDPALGHLADPYDLAQRGNIPVLWDMTLYKGKYYLYWGPVPALVVAAVRQFWPHEVGDAQLVMGFVSGSFICCLLILLHWRKNYFSSLPAGSFLLAALVAGLANPMPWLLSRPAVYEAAIASGQFFLLAGFYALLRARDGPRPIPWHLALAGALWAGALGSRTSLGLGIAFMAGMAAVRLLWWARQTGSLRTSLPGLVCLGAPLALGAAGLAWYNWARFGSVLDFGHRYQITGMNLNRIYAHVFSIANVLPNLHNYLINTFSRMEIFPFIKPLWGLHGMLLRLPVPAPFYSEQVSGLLPAAPFLLLSLLPVAGLGLRRLRQRRNAETQPEMPGKSSPTGLDWDVASLAGGLALIFALDLGYVVSTMRYLADVVPGLALLAALGAWQTGAALHERAFWRRIFSLAVTALAAYTIIVGLLLAVTGYLARFEHLNPGLFERLTRIFTWDG